MSQHGTVAFDRPKYHKHSQIFAQAMNVMASHSSVLSSRMQKAGFPQNKPWRFYRFNAVRKMACAAHTNT